MMPMRKPFSGDPLFPFDLVHRTVRQPETELPDHFHDQFELVYVYDGRGVFFIDNTWWDIYPGNLFFIPGNTIHHSISDPNDPVCSSALFFAPSLLAESSLDPSYSRLLCYEFARKNRQYRSELPERLKRIAEEALDEIDRELRRQLPGYREAVRLVLCRFLLELNRFLPGRAGQRGDGARIGPAWMLEALRQIDEHPEHGISLAGLAEHAQVSAPHFSRVFRRLTTMNVTQYVNAKRIVKAKELLLKTNENVGVIAERCGYETPTHFYRVFKELTGVAPGAYRRGG